MTNPLIQGLFCPSCHGETLSLKNGDVAQSGNARYKCRQCGSRTTRPHTEKPEPLPKFIKQRMSRFIISSSINDAPLNLPQLRSLERAAAFYDAQLILVATVYKNPDASAPGKLSSLSWPTEALPYLCWDTRVHLNKNLRLRADARIPATAVNPLQGANHAGDVVSEIYGHAQVASTFVPTPKNTIPKVLATTGTVSQRNYGGSWTAKKAEFHHNHSALLVEVSGDKFWLTRMPWAKDGYTCGLGMRFHPDRVEHVAGDIAGAVYGDIHWDILRPTERKALRRAIEGFAADKNVLHDVLDFHSGSHHSEGNPHLMFHRPSTDIRAEIERTIDFIASVPNAVVVSSNHHDHLDQWFKRADPRKLDKRELHLYRELMYLASRSPSPLFNQICALSGLKCDFTDPNCEYDIAGVDVSQHGHRGPNGARGSARAFARTGRRTIVGHSHTPGETMGCIQVGTSGLAHAYAQGYSSWMQSHAIIWKCGKRTPIYAVNNRFSPITEEFFIWHKNELSRSRSVQ